jgi:hypothetical protein
MGRETRHKDNTRQARGRVWHLHPAPDPSSRPRDPPPNSSSGLEFHQTRHPPGSRVTIEFTRPADILLRSPGARRRRAPCIRLKPINPPLHAVEGSRHGRMASRGGGDRACPLHAAGSGKPIHTKLASMAARWACGDVRWLLAGESREGGRDRREGGHEQEVAASRESQYA